ncbi:15807_t:CDS:1 [Funneliformis caledonium]|uniref:15807_t:CDS:1 n=1 Tax=Funneliformis caledonium TaxID=1117310 RepID=A0A9N8Z5P8_9GLOM|nr:15807_t:CDS:1 [Funneliformis caledonium]
MRQSSSVMQRRLFNSSLMKRQSTSPLGSETNLVPMESIDNNVNSRDQPLKIWTDQELKTLFDAFSKHGSDWNIISKEYFQESRTPSALKNKWKRANIWTKVEENKLEDAISKHGEDWEFISKEYFQMKRTPRILKIKWKTFLKRQTQKSRTLRDAVKEYFQVSRSPSSLKHKWVRSVNHLTEEEVRLLQDAVSKHGKDWEFISKEYFQTNRTPRELKNKWNNHWTEDEVRKLRDAVAKHGEDWNFITEKYFQASRTSSSINHKWIRSVNHLTEEEGWILIDAVSKHEGDWEFISKKYFQKNRSARELEIKWNTLLKYWSVEEIKKLRDAVSKHGKDWQLISKEYFQANRTVSSLKDKHSRSKEDKMLLIKEHDTDQENVKKINNTNPENQEIYDTKSTNDYHTKTYRKRNKHSWTNEEDQILPELIKNHGIKIAAEMLNRSKRSLYSYYKKKEHSYDSLMKKSNTISKKFQKPSDVGVDKDIETSWIRNLDESSTYKSSLQRCRINWQQLCLQSS